jgi:Tfp pilus assembly protein FimT
MLNYREKKLGFSKIELLLWISILAVLTFLMIPFYNSWKNANSDNHSVNDSNSTFHFE